MYPFDVASGIGGAAEQEAALSVADFGFEPGPAGESWAEAEAIQGREGLIFDLGAGSGEVHHSSSREAVKGPEGRYGEDGAGFAGEISASRGGREAGLVVEQDLALPIVRLNAEDGIGKEQDGNFGSGSFAVWAGHSGW